MPVPPPSSRSDIPAPRRAPSTALSRRGVLRAASVGALAWPFAGLTTACGTSFAGTTLTLGTGGTQGVYYALGSALADAWQRSLRLTARPAVRPTAGSVDNLILLDRGTVDVIFSAADVADRQLGAANRPGRAPRALARIYDDALQVVVPARSPITGVADLRGKRVSIGATDSGVKVMADCLLEVAGMSAPTDLSASLLGIDESIAALRAGHIDAFFWSGGLPTGGVDALSRATAIRLLDLAPQMPELRNHYPVYDVGTVPAGTYNIPEAVTTMFVRNFLLVPAELPDPLAEAMVAGLFEATDALVRANSAGRAIDGRSAIGTEPVPLHPGARRYYQSIKIYD